MATFFAVLEWRSDHPSVSVAFVTSDIRTLLIDVVETRGKLRSIETEYSSFTGFLVLNLIEETRGLNDSDVGATDAFIAEIRSAAGEYETSSSEDEIPEMSRIAKALVSARDLVDGNPAIW